MIIDFIILIILLLFLILFIAVWFSIQQEEFKSIDVDKHIPYTFYWINLDRSIIRSVNMSRLLNKRKIKNVRVSAVDGKLRKDCDCVMACAKSHIKAIRTFYESGEEIGIICEDDLTFEYQKYWRESIVDVVTNAPSDWEVIQIAVIVWDWPLGYIKHYPSNYIPYHDWVSSALCYIINHKGASKLINTVVNDTSEMCIYPRVTTYIYKYPMFTYPTENDSTIHDTHLLFHNYSKHLVTKYLKYKLNKI